MRPGTTSASRLGLQPFSFRVLKRVCRGLVKAGFFPPCRGRAAGIRPFPISAVKEKVRFMLTHRQRLCKSFLGLVQRGAVLVAALVLAGITAPAVAQDGDNAKPKIMI